MEVIPAVVVRIDLVVEPIVDTVRSPPCIGIGNDLPAATVLPAEAVKRFRVQLEVHEAAGLGFPDRIVDSVDRRNAGLLLYILVLGHQRRSCAQHLVAGGRRRCEIDACVRSFGFDGQQRGTGDDVIGQAAGQVAFFRRFKTDSCGFEECIRAGSPPDCRVEGLFGRSTGHSGLTDVVFGIDRHTQAVGSEGFLCIEVTECTDDINFSQVLF